MVNSFRRRQQSQLLLALLCCFVAISFANDVGSTATGRASLSRTRVTGWTKLNERWPIVSQDYFYAVTRGHHQIEVRLPDTIDSDLEVSLQYYYKFARVRPLIQIVPCKSNVDILTDDGTQTAGSWLTHTRRVQMSDCLQRKRLAYNVILHDDEDVFAWKVLEIKSKEPEAPTATELPTEPPTATELSTGPTTTTTESAATSTDSPSSPPGSPQRPPPSEPENQDEQGQTTTTENNPNGPNGSDRQQPDSNSGNNDAQHNDPDQQRTNENEHHDGNQNENQNGNQDGNQNGNQNGNQDGNQNENRDSNQGNPDQRPEHQGTNSRRKRATSEMSLICKPNSCDRNRVHFPTFKTLVGGLSELSEGDLASETYSYHLNTKNEPLKVQIDSDGDDLADYDLCLDMSLYMDEGTSLSLYLDDKDDKDKADKNDGRLLETIERKAGDQMTSKWERVHRCLLDYMPRLAKERPNGPSGEHDEIHKLRLNLVPKSGAPERQKVLVKLAKQEAISKRPYLEPLSHLPNALDAADEREVRRMWIEDRDGPRKAKFRFGNKPISGGDDSHSPQKVLFVDSIEPKQDYFDLTSRWLRVDNPDAPLDDIVVFNYTADRADWIKAIDFEFQRASGAPDYWQAERIYTRPQQQQQRPATQQHVGQITDGATGETTGVRPVSPGPQLIGRPIHVRGLKRGDYRLRLRHHVDREPRIMANLDRHQLAVRSLSFGDACSGARPFCLNGGRCVSKGLSRAECVCPRGYSGDHCQLRRPCEMLYAGATRTGTDFCNSVGATCIEDLPVFRCIWPNDQYYQCQRTWRGDGSSSGGGGGGDGTGGGGAVGDDDQPNRSEQVEKLIEATNKQKQIIFVMGAFMAAMMLFAIVIVINMIMKLRKSNSRLKRVQIEVHELARQNTPSTSGGLSAAAPASAPFGRPGARNKPAAVMAYNNRAFDAAGS